MASKQCEAGRCLRCSAAVSGELKGVILSVCCRDCVLNNTRSSSPALIYDTYFVSKSQAVRKLKCNATRLQALDFTTKEISDGGGVRRTTNLFLLVEVEAIQKLTSGKIRAIRDHKKRLVLNEKLNNLESLLDMKLADLDPVLRHFLVQDYFKEPPTTTEAAIQQRGAVLLRVEAILAECPKAHPEAAFDFCLDHSDGGPKEFQSLKEKMALVFEQEGFRILHKVPAADAFRLEDSAIGDVCTAFLERDAHAIVRQHLIQMVGKTTADAILVHHACQARFRTCAEEQEVAKKLVKFWQEKDDTELRRARLYAALADHELPLREDCALCEAYITGEIDVDVEEVAGVVAMFVAVSAYGSCPHGIRGLRGHEAFMISYYFSRDDFETSVDAAIDAAMTASICSEPCGQDSLSDDAFLFHPEEFAHYLEECGLFSNTDSENDSDDYYY